MRPLADDPGPVAGYDPGFLKLRFDYPWLGASIQILASWLPPKILIGDFHPTFVSK